jgi:WD40 repeat protein
MSTRPITPNATDPSVKPSGSDAVTWITLPPPTPPVLPSVPGYEILGELARGGMGVVYKAKQLGCNRVVALKMILSGSHAGIEERERFLIEAEAVARLQHPNIVQVHEVGEHEGKPFYSMEFCPGGGLDRKLNATPLPPVEAVRLVETLARAVQAAHEKGVVHRDLKPGNILLAEDGTPKVTDFGLAKRLDAAGRTQTGEVLGTPSYMAPEQAGGKSREVGPPTDVYALGAILYECLTGRPPFRGPTALDTLKQVLSDDPVPPRQLLPRTPRDLETIDLKCLDKEPTRRYATAAELAADLGRWQRGEAVLAQPPSLGYLLRKQVRRYWAPLVVAAGMFLLLAAVVATAFVLLVAAWDKAQKNYETADQRRKEVEAAGAELRTALQQKQEALDAQQRAHDSLNKQLAVLARSYAERSDAEFRGGNVRDSLNWMLRAYDVAPSDDPLRPQWVRRIVDWGRSISPRTFRHDGSVNAASFGPDGQTVLTASWDRTARLWNAADGRELHRLSHDGEVWAASFSPDGRTIATASEDRTARLWSAAGDELHRLTHDGPVYAASFSPDGRTLVTASADKTALVWDVASGKELLRLPHEDAVWGASFSPDGRTIATASRDGTARLWDAASGMERRRFPHGGPVNVAWFSPDGRDLLTASGDRAAHLWEIASGKELRQFPHDAEVLGASFSPDGRSIVTVGYDKTARVWDAASGQELQRLPHSGDVLGASFAPDGRTVFTASRDKAARLWEVDFPSPPETVDADRLRAWVLVHTGQDWTDDGVLRPLTTEELHQQQQLLGARGGDWQIAPTPQQWHLTRASQAEADQDWFAARFHLDQLLAADPNNADFIRRRDAAAAHLNPKPAG